MLIGKTFEKSQEFKNKKKFIGLIYGLVSVLSFALFAWGIDAILLARAHAALFWIKFLPGALICGLAGALAGWLTIHYEKHVLALMFWTGLGALYTTMAIWLPTSGTELFLKILRPDLTIMLKFPEIDSISQFRIVGFLIIGVASIICGILEINLVDQILLSAYSSTFASSLFVTLILFGLAGSASDYLINSHFREPVQALNDVLQTLSDYGEMEIPDDIIKEQRLSSIIRLGLDWQKPRQLLLVAFDRTLGTMEILVSTPEALAKCTLIYSQISNCNLVAGAK
jgi:hypothetical protein